MTTLAMQWPILDPDMPITDLKAEATRELRAALDQAGMRPTKPARFTVHHGEDPHLSAVVTVRPETWRRGLTTDNLRALKTVHRCTCGGWTCAMKWQRVPHACIAVEVAA